MRMMFRIRLFLWVAWVRIPKPWRKRKYNKIFEQMQQAVKKKKKKKKIRSTTIFQKKPVN